MMDLFSGSLGRLNNHGGSRMFTTPNTRCVPIEYEVDTNVPSAAEFVTCSLDGRLWVFRRSRRYYVAVFRWDGNTQRLVFVNNSILSNANIIGRGIDWVLTDSLIIQAADNEPYIATANLFEGSGISSVYSALRSETLSLQPVNKHYSLIPAVGDWFIIKNFLVRKPDNPLSEAYNSMLNIKPLIPLEFYRSYPSYGCGDDNDISLTCFNGQLWGRGRYHFGKCYILPAVFDEDGTPQEFYLYISPDYTVSPYLFSESAATGEEWLNMGILHTDDNVYGFIHEQASSLDNELSYKANNHKLFVPSANLWQTFPDNSHIFVDTLNHSGLVLHDNGATFLNAGNKSYECNGLLQWLAPAGKVDAVTSDSVLASWDNNTLATHFQQGFHRELLSGKTLPLNAKAYSGKRLSLGLKGKNIQVNSIAGHNQLETVAWEDVYKPAVEINALNFFSSSLSDEVWGYPDSRNQYPVFLAHVSYKAVVAGYYTTGYHGRTVFSFSNSTTAEIHTISGTPGWSDNGYVETFPAFSYSVGYSGFYILPDSGQIKSFAGTTEFTSNIGTYRYEGDKYDSYDFYGRGNDAIVDIPGGFVVIDGFLSLGYQHWVAHEGNINYEYGQFRPLVEIPSYVTDWQSKPSTGLSGNLSLQSIQIPQNIPDNISYSASAVFSEKHSKSRFLCNIPSAFSHDNTGTSGTCAHLTRTDFSYFSYWNVHSISDDETSYNQGLHVAQMDNEQFMVFRTELHPEIFNFKSEVERSYLS